MQWLSDAWRYTGARLKRPVQTQEWLRGLVDSVHFPNVHGSYTREEALNMESQVMFPAYDSDA
jgi:hypothetical protein